VPPSLYVGEVRKPDSSALLHCLARLAPKRDPVLPVPFAALLKMTRRRCSKPTKPTQQPTSTCVEHSTLTHTPHLQTPSPSTYSPLKTHTHTHTDKAPVHHHYLPTPLTPCPSSAKHSPPGLACPSPPSPLPRLHPPPPPANLLTYAKIFTFKSFESLGILEITAFTVVYSFNAYSPKSLPIPLCLYPPNGTLHVR